MNLKDQPSPRFSGKASVTSDGYVMCDFTDNRGEFHPGAFVGSMTDLTDNVNRLKTHLHLGNTDQQKLDALVASWIGSDWRAK